jgi:hypothetical protein
MTGSRGDGASLRRREDRVMRAAERRINIFESSGHMKEIPRGDKFLYQKGTILIDAEGEARAATKRALASQDP